MNLKKVHYFMTHGTNCFVPTVTLLQAQASGYPLAYPCPLKQIIKSVTFLPIQKVVNGATCDGIKCQQNGVFYVSFCLRLLWP